MKPNFTTDNRKFMNPIDPRPILRHFYPEDNPLRRLLITHSTQVRDKALELAHSPAGEAMNLDLALVETGAMLHDIGILRCQAPKILCNGPEPYLAHGLIGANMLREYAGQHGIDLEPFARICERHTGSGITADEVRLQQLPIPEQDFLPETPEEILVCLADKFYSKSGDMQEKSLPRIRRSLEKFGPGPLARFDAMCRLFDLKPELKP